MSYYQAAKDFAKAKVSEIRTSKNRGYIRYLQVGACDGELMDFAFHATTKDDHGILIEPNEAAFTLLQENKKDYAHCTLLKCAILPEKFINQNLRFQIQTRFDPLPLGSSFIKLQHTDMESEDTTIISIKELLAKHIPDPIDCLFTDIEGFDADFVTEYTDYQQPDFVMFESWDYSSHHLDQWNLNLMYRSECFENLKNKGYVIEQFGEDICAFKP